MGQTTLAQFRLRMQAALGNQGYADALIDGWVNAGLQEMAGAVEFDDLKAHGTIDFVANVYEYGLPPEVVVITGAGWEAENRWLVKTGPESMLRFNRETPSLPKLYAKRGRTFMLYPTPDRAGTLDIFFVTDVELLVGTTDTTQFPTIWDEAVYKFAVAAALLDLGEDERSLVWHDRAVKYAGSRLTEAEQGSEGVSMPVFVAKEFGDLYKQRSL